MNRSGDIPCKDQKRIIVYWPFSHFHEVHVKKDPGRIPSAFVERGFEVYLVVGRYDASPIRSINVVETGNSHDKILSFKSQISELLFILKLIEKTSPKLFLTYNRNPLFFLVIALTKWRSVVSKSERPIFAMKLDSDGNFRFTNFPEIIDNKLVESIFRSLATLKFMTDTLFFDYITTETECALERLNRFVRKKENLKVVPNGYDSNLLPSRNVDDYKEPTILSVARITRQKSLETLISAFSVIEEESIPWKVKVVGPIEDPVYHSELVKTVDSFHLSKRILFLGELGEKDLISEYTRASIFCLPSKWESYCISRLEAISFGLPVVTTEAGCGKTLEPFGSIVVPINDFKGMAEGILRLIKSPKLRNTISISQRDALISWKEVGDMYLSLAGFHP